MISKFIFHSYFGTLLIENGKLFCIDRNTHVSLFVVVHNHPSGDPTPSDADRLMTKQIQDAAKLLGLRLCDHIIQGTKEDDPRGVGYYSFAKDDYSFITRGRYGEND